MLQRSAGRSRIAQAAHVLISIAHRASLRANETVWPELTSPHLEELRMTGLSSPPLATPRRRRLALAILAIISPLASYPARAGDTPSIAGHWPGVLKAGGRTLDLDLDFAKKDGLWTGDISIPAQ